MTRKNSLYKKICHISKIYTIHTRSMKSNFKYRAPKEQIRNKRNAIKNKYKKQIANKAVFRAEAKKWTLFK